MRHKLKEPMLTYDNVLVEPAAATRLSASQVSIGTKLTKDLTLALPFFVSPMEITGSRLAIAMALQGGMAIIPYVENQLDVVLAVKRHAGKFIDRPTCVGPEATVADVNEVARVSGHDGVFVVDADHRLLGLSTSVKRMYCLKPNTSIAECMVPYRHREAVSPLVVGRVGMTADEAFEFMSARDIKILAIVDDEGVLTGIYPGKDLVETRVPGPASKDALGRLRVGAAIGKKKDYERARALIAAGADLIVIDTSTGNHVDVVTTIKWLKKHYPHVPVMAGNVATLGAALHLAKAGADIIRVGVGPGSICTTRVVTGHGVPQLGALMSIALGLRKAGYKHVKIVADGGLRESGDIVKALVFADAVMFGGLVAGTDEAEGELFHIQGVPYKQYRGMGSLGAMRKAGILRYDHTGAIVVPEGEEGVVIYVGPLAKRIGELAGGVRKGFAMSGAATHPAFKRKARLIRVTQEGVAEGRAHDITVIKSH